MHPGNSGGVMFSRSDNPLRLSLFHLYYVYSRDNRKGLSLREIITIFLTRKQLFSQLQRPIDLCLPLLGTMLHDIERQFSMSRIGTFVVGEFVNEICGLRFDMQYTGLAVVDVVVE